MRRLTIISALFVILDLSPNVRAVEIEGNKLFSDRELTKLIDFTLPDDSLTASILSLYHENGYFSARVENIDFNSRGERRIIIDERKLSRIASIEIDTVPDSAGEFLVGLARQYEDEPATGEILDEFAERAISRLANNGMPFAQGEWSEFDFTGDNDLRARFRIIAGPRCYISGFEFEGTSRSRPGALEKVLNLNIGELYSESRLLDSERSLQKMKYIEIESPFRPQVTGSGDSCRIVYDLKELPSTSFDGAGGLVNTGSKTEFLGRLDLEFGDIAGTGRSFGFKWNKKDRFSNELAIEYSEPFFLGTRFDMNLGVFQLDRDSLYVETGARIGFDYRFSRDLRAAIGLSTGRTEPEEGSSVAASLKRSVDVVFSYDGTDFSGNPRQGYQIRSEIEYRYRSNRRVVEGDDPPTKLSAVGLDGGYFGRLTGRLVMAFLLKSWGIVSSDGIVPADELAFIGGFDVLRGYTEDRFRAYRYAVVTFEPRIVTGKGRIYIFGDLGVIKSSSVRDDDYRFFPGYGAGIVSPTAIGLFKIEMAWGKEGFPSEAVLNLGLVGTF
jgi:outer membrane protein assembly factor BamA